MQETFPIVSVIIPTYNYAKYISNAINSVLEQDYPLDKIEIIVMDDGSTDGTKDVLSHYNNNKAIQYYYQPNQGKASATYKAIQNSNGKYIFNLDADDYFLPGKIRQTVEVFETDESLVHVATPAQIFDQNNGLIKGAEVLPQRMLEVKMNGSKLLYYFYQNNILYGGGSTFAARASILKQINIPIAVDMYIDEFLMLAILPFGKSFFLKEALSVWRVHKNNYSVGITDYAEKIHKAQRLLKASMAVLNYLKENDFSKKLVNIYRLKNLNREIAFKESAKTKKLTDIYNYAKEVFFKIKPGWKLIKNYQVINRLLPLSIYTFLKKSSF